MLRTMRSLTLQRGQTYLAMVYTRTRGLHAIQPRPQVRAHHDPSPGSDQRSSWDRDDIKNAGTHFSTMLGSSRGTLIQRISEVAKAVNRTDQNYITNHTLAALFHSYISFSMILQGVFQCVG